MRITKKLIKSGHVYEYYSYKYGVRVGEPNRNKGRAAEANEEGKRENRKKTKQRARATIRRLINANIEAWGYPPIFLTLTFAENVKETREANYEFKKFRQRLERRIGKKLKYVAVVEYQKRGAVHYHVVLFNLPFIEANELAGIWGNGYIKINEIENVDNVGAYVTKYLTKEGEEDKLEGEKSYFRSRGLMEPEEIIEEKEIEQVRTVLSHYKVYEADFKHDYTGEIHYEQYNLKRKN